MKHKQNLITHKAFLIILGAVMLSGISKFGYSDFFNKTTVTSSSPQTIEQARNQSYGSKPTIAVMKFENKSGSYGHYGGAPIGSGMKEQLVTALTQTNAFIVVERDAMRDIIGEQDFGTSGRVRGNTAAAIGEIEGADFLIYGAVTEYEGNQAEAKTGIAGWSGTVFSAVKGAISQDHVAIDLRIVDSKTGRVLNATSVEGKSKDLKAGIGGMFGNSLSGLSGGYKNPLQKAVRSCMIQAVNWIANNLMGKSANAATRTQSHNRAQTRTVSHSQAPSHSQSLTPQQRQPVSQKPSVKKPLQASPKQQSSKSAVDKLKELKFLKDEKLITEEDYNDQKKKILEDMRKQ